MAIIVPIKNMLAIVEISCTNQRHSIIFCTKHIVYYSTQINGMVNIAPLKNKLCSSQGMFATIMHILIYIAPIKCNTIEKQFKNVMLVTERDFQNQML